VSGRRMAGTIYCRANPLAAGPTDHDTRAIRAPHTLRGSAVRFSHS
jgi:hypothetical protein